MLVYVKSVLWRDCLFIVSFGEEMSFGTHDSRVGLASL